MHLVRRYAIEAIDPRTYTIMDLCGSGACYMLLITSAYGNHCNVQVTIAEVSTDMQSPSENHVQFVRETWTFKWFAATWDHVIRTVGQILNELNAGMDPGNPAEFSAMFGGELHGVEVQWPPQRLNDLH